MDNLLIVIIVFNNDRLVSKQADLIRKFCLDKHDILIVNNSTDPAYFEPIKKIANGSGSLYLQTKIGGDASYSHGTACNNSFATVKDNYRYFMYLDHDIFPLRPFSVKTILAEGNSLTAGPGIIAGSGQSRNGVSYYWPGLVMWDGMSVDKEIIDFSPNAMLGLDTGGNLFKVIEKYGKNRCIFLNERHVDPDFSKKDDPSRVFADTFYVMHNDDMFMHFVNYSNWAKCPKHNNRIQTLIDILDSKIL